jgi:hypothetical protein
VRRYAEYFGKTVDHFPPLGFAGWPGNAWERLGAEIVALSSVSSDETVAGTGLRPIADDGEHIYLLEN